MRIRCRENLLFYFNTYKPGVAADIDVVACECRMGPCHTIPWIGRNFNRIDHPDPALVLVTIRGEFSQQKLPGFIKFLDTLEHFEVFIGPSFAGDQ